MLVSSIFNFHPKNWEDEPILTNIFFRRVGSTTNHFFFFHPPVPWLLVPFYILCQPLASAQIPVTVNVTRSCVLAHIFGSNSSEGEFTSAGRMEVVSSECARLDELKFVPTWVCCLLSAAFGTRRSARVPRRGTCLSIWFHENHVVASGRSNMPWIRKSFVSQGPCFFFDVLPLWQRSAHFSGSAGSARLGSGHNACLVVAERLSRASFGEAKSTRTKKEDRWYHSKQNKIRRSRQDYCVVVLLLRWYFWHSKYNVSLSRRLGSICS